MPWKETDVMSERLEFVVRALQPGRNLSALCREFGISRKTGYKWLHRFREVGSLSGLREVSRRPRRSPHQTSVALENRVVALRSQYGWGSKKLCCLLLREGIEIPRITVDRILKRRGLVQRSTRHRPAVRRFERSRPNELWQMDFKGEYRLRPSGKCYPLSVLDDHSRFCVALRALDSPKLVGVQSSLIRTFEQYGLPETMLIDHGTPWWSTTNGHGLTKLSVFLIRQGIDLIYSGIGHPQTQGKVERFHRTLSDSVAHQGQPSTLSSFQVCLNGFRSDYNTIRPHEALSMVTPIQRYHPSHRAYEPRPRRWEYPEGAQLRQLNAAGCLEWQQQRYFVSEALAKQRVWCQLFERRLLVTYRSMQVREIDLETGRTTAVVRPHKPPQVLPMS